MPTIEEILAQREALAAQPVEPVQAPNVPTSLLGKIAVGANAIAQKKDIGQTFRDLRQQRSSVLDANRKRELSNNEQQLEVAQTQKKNALAEMLKDPMSSESKRIQSGYKNFLKGSLKNMPGVNSLKLNFDFVDTISGNELGEMKPLDMVKLIAQQSAELQQNKAKENKTDESDYKESRKAVQQGAMAAVAGGRGTTQTVGRSVRRVQDAKNAKQLLSAASDPKSGIIADPQLASELAVSVAALLGGGNAPAESTIKSLVPASIRGDAAKVQQYITGNPQQFFTPARIQQLSHTLDREIDYWSNEKNKFGAAYRKSLHPYFKKYPDLEQAFDETISAAAEDTSLPQAQPIGPTSGLTPEQRQARIKELQVKIGR